MLVWEMTRVAGYDLAVLEAVVTTCPTTWWISVRVHTLKAGWLVHQNPSLESFSETHCRLCRRASGHWIPEQTYCVGFASPWRDTLLCSPSASTGRIKCLIATRRYKTPQVFCKDTSEKLLKYYSYTATFLQNVQKSTCQVLPAQFSRYLTSSSPGLLQVHMQRCY